MEAAYREHKLSKNLEKQPTALVAGGSGFLGSYLCEALTSQNFNVICVDNLSSGKKTNIEKLLSLPNFSFLQEDITKPTFTISPTLKIDYVFHLASVEEDFSSVERSLDALLVNSLGTKNLLDIAVAKQAKFILVSSADVYNAALAQTNLKSYFGKRIEPGEISFSESKRFAESLAAGYFKKFNLHTNIIRVKDLYGPRMNINAKNKLAALIRQAITGNKIELAGDGLATLHPTFVTDGVFGLVKAALQGDKGDIFSLVNPNKFTERTIAETLVRITGNLEIEFKKGDWLELPEHPLLITFTENKLSWEPKIPLDQGLSQTVSYYKNLQSGEEDKLIELPSIQPVENLKNKTKRRHSSWLKIFFPIALTSLVLWFLVIPLISLFYNFKLAERSLEVAFISVNDNKFSEAAKSADQSGQRFRDGQSSLRRLRWLAVVPGLKSKADQTNNYLFYNENLAFATKFLSLSLDTVTKSDETDLSESEIDSAVNNLSQAKKNLEIVKTVPLRSEQLPGFLKSNYRYWEQRTDLIDEMIGTLEESL